jgi:VWFA-related protein
MKRWAVLLLLVPACSVVPAQNTPIKVEVPTVVVDVIVTDRKGHQVSGLTKDSFSVLEDNAPQEIVSFSAPGITPTTERDYILSKENKPNGNSAVIAVPAQVPANERKPQSITFLIDLGDIQSTSLKSACDAAAQYVEKAVAEGNQISIYWVDTSLHLAVPFTNDKERLLAAIKKLSSRVPNGRLTARERILAQQKIDDLFITIHPETRYGSAAKPGQGDPMTKGLEWDMDTLRSWLVISNTFQARGVFMALRALALAYRDLPGRKSVVVFSEGFLHAGDVGAEMQAVIDAANRAGVAFYVIDASGSKSGMTADAHEPDIGGRRSAPDPAVDGFGTTLGRDVFDWNETLTSDVHSDLGNIANATGGFLVSDTNNLLRAIERVERDGGEFYTLVYHPTKRVYDGEFRKIKVALATGGGYRLRYRQGYWGIPPGREVMMTPAGAQLLHALESGTQTPSFAPDLRAALVQSREGGFAVAVAASLPGNRVPFEKKKDSYAAGVTMLLVARDASGQLISLYERYGDLRFDKKEWTKFRQETFNLNGHLPVVSLEPITVQAIVKFSNGGVTGVSARVPLVGDAGEAEPKLTSLVLSNRVEQADCSADLTDPLCLTTLRLYLPAHARFLASDKLTVYFTALALAADPRTREPGLQVTFDLISGEKGAPIVADRVQAVRGNTSDSLMVLAAFDLRSLRPGKYTLQANVEDAIRNRKSAGRVEFVVE